MADEEIRNTLIEIKNWEEKLLKPGTLSKVGNLAGKPAEWIFKLLPNAVTNTVTKAIVGVFGLLLFTSNYTFSKKTVFKRVSKMGGTYVTDISQLKNQDIKVLKKAASSYVSRNNILSALEGFGCGMGGAVLIAADIPLIFGIAFRVIQEIGYTFGYDMELPEEKQFIMSIIDLGTCVPTAGKVESMLGKESLKNYVKKETFKKMEQLAAVKLSKKGTEEIAKEILHTQGKRATKKAVEKMAAKVAEDVAKDGTKAVIVTEARKSARKIGETLTKRKFMQVVPVLGGIVGAGFNFWFVWSVGDAAYYAYLKRFIYDNYNV